MDKAAFLARWRQLKHDRVVNVKKGLQSCSSVYACTQQLTYADVTTVVVTSFRCVAATDEYEAKADPNAANLRVLEYVNPFVELSVEQRRINVALDAALKQERLRHEKALKKRMEKENGQPNAVHDSNGHDLVLYVTNGPLDSCGPSHHNAAITIQCSVRQFLAKRAVGLMRARQQWSVANRGAVLIQSTYRGHASRQEAMRYKMLVRWTAACFIQRRYRIWIAKRTRKLLQSQRNERLRHVAAVNTQRVVRGHVNRKSYRLWRLVLEACCLLIQRVYKGHRVRTTVKADKLHKATGEPDTDGPS